MNSILSVSYIFQQIINLLAPHLLVDHAEECRSVIGRVVEHEPDTIDDFPTSTIDPAVFRSSRSRVRKGGTDDP